jgi:hypothetical protein
MLSPRPSPRLKRPELAIIYHRGKLRYSGERKRPVIKCLACGKEVYKKAKACPGCGRPYPGYPDAGLGKALPGWFVALALVLIWCSACAVVAVYLYSLK